MSGYDLLEAREWLDKHASGVVQADADPLEVLRSLVEHLEVTGNAQLDEALAEQRDEHDAAVREIHEEHERELAAVREASDPANLTYDELLDLLAKARERELADARREAAALVPEHSCSENVQRMLATTGHELPEPPKPKRRRRKASEVQS